MKNEHKEILLVDDEPEFRDLIQKKLKAAGYHVVLAQSGEEALVALWERQGIDLVLLDIRLPYINGMNVSEIIRQDFFDKKIIVTSVLQKEEQQFLIDDADDYFYKGEDLDSLLEKIDRIFVNNSVTVTSRQDEKRVSRRIPVNVLASCESTNFPTSTAPARFFSYTKDLSVQGARFVVPEDIQVGQRFSAALELPVHFLPLLIDCEVRWVKKLDGPEMRSKKSSEVGVKFLKLDMPQDEKKLQNYLNLV